MPIVQFNPVESPTAGQYRDTWIDGANATTNHGIDSSMILGVAYYIPPTKGALGRLLMEFDVSSLAGATINSAELQLYVASRTLDGGADDTGFLTRLRRYTGGATNWIHNQATWNVYATSTNWGTAGAGNTTSDIDTATPGTVNFTLPSGTGTWTITGMADYVTDALSSRNSRVGIHMRLNSESDNGLTRTVTIGTVEGYNSSPATYLHPPILEVDYTIGTGHRYTAPALGSSNMIII